MLTNLQFFHYVFDFFFAVWPIILAGAFKGALKHVFANMLVIWCLLAAVRGFIAFTSEPIVFSFLIPEPLSTFIFLFVGVILVAIKVMLPMWQKAV